MNASRPARRTVTGLFAAALLFARLGARAAIVGPYTADANTLHLWHMDAGAVPVPDAVAGGGTNLMTLANGASLGAASYPGFGTALNTLDGGQNGIATTDKDAYLAASPSTGNLLTKLADPSVASFTFEALVWIGFDPAKNFGPTASGGNGRASTCEIVTAESMTSANRLFQFRVTPIGGNSGNTTVNLDFVNVNLGASQLLSMPIPTTGPDAILSNHWYHAAVTYNGLPNTPANLTFYWTLLDPSRLSANAIGAAVMQNDLPAAPSVLGIGNIPGRTLGHNFLGLIDEVRISNIARPPSNMMFAPSLALTRQGSQLILAWATNPPAFLLEYETNLNSGNWVTLSNTVIVNGQYRITETPTNRSRFYRLLGTQSITPPTDLVTKRKSATMLAALFAPWPDTNANPSDPSTEFIGKTAYALAAYYAHNDVTTADAFINALHDTSYLGVQDSEHFVDPNGNDWPWEFSLPLLLRIAMDDDINGSAITNSMSATARTNLLDMLWFVIRERGATNDAGSDLNDVWGVLRSENHNAVWRSAFFLAAQCLNNAGPPYGPGGTRNKLLDGGKLVDHYNAWLAYWMEYFRQRAREGLSLEVRSPTYEKYTLASYYDIMDLGGAGSDRAAVQLQASQFVTLYWADVAQEFCPGATIPGGAGCRMYQSDTLTTGTAFSLRNWLYMYDWHDTPNSGTAHPEILCAAISPYEIPGIVTAIATNSTKAPYEYNSHRLGAGTDTTHDETGFANLTTPAYVRRDTQWTPDFVMGSMTYDTTKTYTMICGENRFCGVQFSSGVNDRLIAQGIGTAKTATADQLGVSSASNKQTLAAALGNDNYDNAGMRLFMANTLYNHIKTNGNWLLAYAGNGYAAIRVATGGYSWVTTNNDGTACADGIYLKLGDKWSPLIVQCGRAADYGSFNSFTNAVLTATYFNWDSVNSVMTYTNLLGQRFMMWRQSDNLPWVGPGPREQSPTYLYQSPYISASTYGGLDSTLTINYPGFTDLVLDFDYP